MQITVTATQAGKLDAWIDWNGNGSWSESGEQVFSNQSLEPVQHPDNQRSVHCDPADMVTIPIQFGRENPSATAAMMARSRITKSRSHRSSPIPFNWCRFAEPRNWPYRKIRMARMVVPGEDIRAVVTTTVPPVLRAASTVRSRTSRTRTTIDFVAGTIKVDKFIIPEGSTEPGHGVIDEPGGNTPSGIVHEAGGTVNSNEAPGRGVKDLERLTPR